MFTLLSHFHPNNTMIKLTNEMQLNSNSLVFELEGAFHRMCEPNLVPPSKVVETKHINIYIYVYIMNRKKKRRRIEGRKDGRTEVEEIL